MTGPHPPRHTPILPLDETALGTAADRLEAWLAFAETNRPGHDHLRDVGYENYPISDADLEILLLDFRHHRPTQWAYDRACEALEKHRQRADRAEAERDRLATENATYARAPHPDDAYMHGFADGRKEADDEWQPLRDQREQLIAAILRLKQTPAISRDTWFAYATVLEMARGTKVELRREGETSAT